ncbi:MAG: rhomboid family intramembrane serine protease [Chloroflexi bacterium]|nr:rhomboid family intramembrane serine protease [Chloroflexota bacterium]
MIPLSDPELRRRSFPVVNVCLIALSATVFVYELLLSERDLEIFFYRFAVIPNELAHGAAYTTLSLGRQTFDITTPYSNWITPFAAMFMHGGWLHFLGNMLFLWVFGDNVEDRLGKLPYLLFYLGTGLAATWLQIAAGSRSELPNIGASGAIAGVLGAYLVLFPLSRIRTLVVFGFFVTTTMMPAVLLIGIWIALQFFSGVASLGAQAGGGVAYWAHVGGFGAGLALVALYKLVRRQPLWPRGTSSWR